MKLEFQMVTEFGEFLTDGHLGNQFRTLRIESIWERVESVVFDFTGVSNLTDSFVHACFGNMAEEYGEEFSSKVRFKGCSPLVRSFVSIAVSEGLKKHREMHTGRRVSSSDSKSAFHARAVHCHFLQSRSERQFCQDLVVQQLQARLPMRGRSPPRSTSAASHVTVHSLRKISNMRNNSLIINN